MKLSPPQWTLLYLSVLAVVALVVKWDPSFVVNRLLGLLALSVGYFAVTLTNSTVLPTLFKKPALFNVLITLLILFLISDEFVSPLWLVVPGLLAGLAKRFLRWRAQPIFNPAAFGLWAAGWVGILATWWGVSFEPRFTALGISGAALLTVPVGVWVVGRYQKLLIPVTVLLSYWLVITLLQQRWSIGPTVEGTLFFFALIMVTEPKTSPISRPQQLIYGAMVGVLAGLLTKVSWLPSAHLTALLVGNAAMKLQTWWQLKNNPVSKAAMGAV